MAVNTKKQTNDLNLLPQNIEAEEAILGAILVNPDCITKIVEHLKPESFYKPAHRFVYEAMLELFNNNDRIDIVSVSDVLNYNQKLDIVGGRAFINDLSYKTITTSNVEYYINDLSYKTITTSIGEYYARIVQEKAIKRA